MATIKEIAKMVGVSSSAVSRVLNYDEGISVSEETRAAIFEAAEKIGYKKKEVYPKIDNVALLCFAENEDELEDSFYNGIKDEIIKQAEKVNIQLQIFDRKDEMEKIPKNLNAFIAVGWLSRHEINKLYEICQKGVFVGTSPDEKLFDAVRPNMDSFLTQMVDYLMEKGYQRLGFIGGTDRNIDTGKPSMDIREWSFRQSVAYYNCLDEDLIVTGQKYTVEEGYRLGKELLNKKILPDAVCIASDTLAVGVLQALNEQGIKVPEQMGIFSINDMSIGKYLSPPLTTIHIDIPCICETALDLLRSRVIKGGNITKSVFVNGIPVIRKSC